MAKNPEMTKVLYYEGLANHALPKIEVAAHTRDYTAFLANSRSEFGARIPVEDIGIYYSSSSELAFMTPGGFLDMNKQPHTFACYGWGTALEELHYQYRFVPEWKLTLDNLKNLKMLIIPDSVVFDRSDVLRVLEPWVQSGGMIVVTGNSGLRKGEGGNFAINEDGLSLASLTGVQNIESASDLTIRHVGLGTVAYIKQNLGMNYYLKDKDRSQLLTEFQCILEQLVDDKRLELRLDASNVPTTVGLSVFEDETAGRLFVDVYNMNIDPETDCVTPSPPISFALRIPRYLCDKEVNVRVLSPEDGVQVSWNSTDEDASLEIGLSPITYYTSIVIE